MDNLLLLTMFMLISPGMDTTNAQTTDVYDKQYHIQEEFVQLLDDPKKDFLSHGEDFILKLINNRTKGTFPPISLSHYCLLQTIWALASGHTELAETYVNKTVCYDASSEEWLENFRFDPSMMFDLVKVASKMDKRNEILKKIAVSISIKYNVLTKAAERADDSLIIWLKKAGLDMARNGSEAIASAWTRDHIDTTNLLFVMGAFGNDSVRLLVNISNSNGETLLHFAARRGLKSLAKKLIDGGATVDQKDVNSLTPLYHAVRANEKEMVRLLLRRGADLTTRSLSGSTLLHLAVMENHFITVSSLLELGLGIQTEDYEGITPLFLAAELEHETLMDLLIKRGADANYKTSSGDTLLHLAVKRRSLMAVKNLIKHGASIDLKNSEDLTPLYEAANVGSPELIWFLLNKGAARHDSTSGDSLLHIAARRGDTRAIESLVNLCIPVDELNQKGVTPLYSAASAGSRAAMELLMSKGADIYVTLTDGRRLLHVAAVQGHVVTIESLLVAGTHVDLKDTHMLTALSRAVQKDNIVSVALLIEKGANTSFRTTEGDTLLHLAAVSNSHESIQLLVEHGLDIDAENDQNETPLYLAAKHNNTKTADLLIALGANKNYVTSGGGSLAHLAAARNDFLALETLFRIGADFNAVDKDGYTPLYSAIRKSEALTANIMLKNGVDLFFNNHHNDSQLHIAARNTDHSIIDFLIDRGVYIDSHGSNGSRPIDVALHEGNCDTAEYFIKKGANVRGKNGMNRTILHSAVIGSCDKFLKHIAVHIDNIDPKDQNMQTPLHLAVALGRIEISETLIMLGADVNSVDRYNSTPFQIAVVNRDWNLVSSFLKRDVKLDWTDADKRTLLHLATLENKEDVVKYLTEQMRVNINVQDVDGRIPLHLAAEKGWTGIMSYLIDERAAKNIDYRDNEGKTPLHLSVIEGHESAVAYLLDNGADPEAGDQHRQTPVIYAAKHRDWRIAGQLLRKMCVLPSTKDIDEEKSTVLHIAATDGELDIISSNKQCLEKLINTKDSEGKTPLELALAAGNQDIVSYFFENYRSTLNLKDCIAMELAEVGIWGVIGTLSASEVGSKCRDEKNRTLLHLAAQQGEENIVQFLLQNSIAELDAMDADNCTALHLAVMEDWHVIERILLEYGARKDIYDKDHMTPLTIALANESWESVFELSKNETDVRWTDAYHRTLLHNAALNGKRELVEYLLKNTNIDINAKDINFDTALLLVATQNNLPSSDRQDIIDDLVHNGADWNLLDKQKRNILHLVATTGDEETLKHILDTYRLDINGQDINAQTPLHIAIINEHYKMIDTLLGYGADRNMLDSNNSTPLVYAIEKRFDAVNLLDKFTDLNWSDAYNRSILHLAAINGCSGVAWEFLNLDLGKNIDRSDINGQTPLHYASSKNDKELVDLLLQGGANGHHLDKINRSPLDLAVESSGWRAVEALVTSGYYKENRYEQGSGRNRTLLHIAIMNGLRNTIDYLINNQVTDFAARDDLGDTPLHIASRNNDHITIKELLDKRVEKFPLNDMGENPLAVAMVEKSWRAVSQLLEGNCDVEGVDRRNRTLLHYAAMDGNQEVIDHLLSCRNVDINALDANHETTLDILLRNETLHLINQYSTMNWRDGKGRTLAHHCFLTSNFPFNWNSLWIIDAKDNDKQTPMHIASLQNLVSWTGDLLRYGFSINSIDINGHSPLHLAAMHGKTEVIEEFLHRCCRSYNVYSMRLEDNVGLRLNARDLLGRTPLQLALDNGDRKSVV